MQVIARMMVDPNMNHEYGGVPFMPGQEEMNLLYRASAGDAEARLELVKGYLNLVVELAAGYSSKTGRPFSQMVKAGTLAVIRAADEFQPGRQLEFDEQVRFYIVRAMEEFGNP